MKKLENLKWSPKWVSHLGCVKGCLDYLGIEMKDAWLYGGSGHAFILNISEDSCPSSPTAWKTMMLFQQAENLGYQIKSVFGSKYQQDLSELQKKSWELARKSIDEGLPLYGWELDIPEFYIVYGYGEGGYYFSGPGAEEGKGPKSWTELGDTGIGLVELHQVRPTKAQTPTRVVKSAFEKVLYHASNPPDWIFENYDSGLKGYDTWIRGLESGKSNRFGMGYNAAVWSECRHFAVDFLREAREQLTEKTSELFLKAIQHYQRVADLIEQVAQLYPWIPQGGPQTIPVDDACQKAAGWLREARQAESNGLAILEQIAAEIV